MLKILIVFGTRPELIKLAPVIKEFNKYPDKYRLIICDTCQHSEMIKLHYDIFKITPKYSFKIMKENQSLFYIFNKVLINVKKIIGTEQPDYLLVQGDTTTALSAAWAGFLSNTKIGHIEAGLRTGDLSNPFPEEANRKVIDHLSDILFVPTVKAKNNLIKEGVNSRKIFITGNTIIDAIKLIKIPQNSIQNFLRLKKKKKILFVSIHRREIFGKQIEAIFNAIRQIAKKFNDSILIVFPVHPNPNVKVKAYEILANQENILLTKPLDYQDSLSLMKSAYLVLTDSGGLVEEASFFGKPVVILRDKTERYESIKAQVAVLGGTKTRRIFRIVSGILNNRRKYQSMARRKQIYGNGKASQKIAKIILK